MGEEIRPSPATKCGRCGRAMHACSCTTPYVMPADQAELDRQNAATELQTLLGVPPGTQGVRLPED